VVKNLRIFSSYKKYKTNKLLFHKLVSLLTSDLDFIVESLPINFISSDQIITINKEYLNHNYSTDIITFNYSGSNKNLDGEIFISVDDAKINAKVYNNSLKEELARLVIHGILHLIGYDDKKKSDFKKMKELENSLLNKYKITLLK
jgi:probable rRNA maturation factor